MLTHMVLRVTLIGAEWVLWVLFMLSFVSIGIIVDRMLYFHRHKVDGEDLGNKLSQLLRANNLQGAWELVAEEDNIEGEVVKAGLVASQRGSEACSEAMQSARAREKGQVDSKLAILGTIGSNAPFVGLLGTVLGIIKAAHDMGGQASGTTDPGAVMAGVFEALVATAVGLCVAIPAVVFFNGLMGKVKNTLAQVDSLAHLVLANISPPQRHSSSAPAPGSTGPASQQPKAKASSVAGQ